MQFFYSNQIEQDRILFDDTEVKHIKSSLRKKEGDLIQVLDGNGYLYDASFQVQHNKYWAEIKNKHHFEAPPFELLLAIAPTKNPGRFDTMIEKCTELGCSQIIPLISRHSERRNVNLTRIKKIMVSALKQSGHKYLPKVHEPILFDDLVTKWSEYEQKFIAHCHISPLPFLGNMLIKHKKVAVLIGPEGDFSKEEVKRSLEVGFEAVSLGPQRLRTETAGIYVCSIFAMINQM